ncbi:MAG: bifunctional transaldolase/phosoglucose isomerase, partial [Anaerolineales bacterium]|nr:bifunctional transaldolase/phosoglucose isomerase [Anaerolineales bacterium]
MNPIQAATKEGQSLWLDFISRDLLQTGELKRLIAAGDVRGVTSNPSIFEAAIADSDQYTADVRRLAQAGWKAPQIFDALAVDDIRAAADAFLPLYHETDGGDGYVSIEVDPALADKTKPTISEARRLWGTINRPNLMVKIPATKAGLPAIEACIADGININVTLIFSLERYAEVIDAYLRGLELRLAKNGGLKYVASVASFFVSRVDVLVDSRLQAIVDAGGEGAERAGSLLGKAAIANAKLAYAQFEAAFGSERFAALRKQGARVQRPLWASTSTKNPAYLDTYYVDSLVGVDTVNTVPPATLDAFRDHGDGSPRLQEGLSAARAQLSAIEALGISMTAVTDQLEQEGVGKFIDAFKRMLKTIQTRARGFARELGTLQDEYAAMLGSLDSGDVVKRIWQEDASLWSQNPAETAEIKDRLGWLTLSEDASRMKAVDAFVEKLQAEGVEQVVLLGMGGSSLAADALRRMFPTKSGIELLVLDSTDPDSIRWVARRAPVASSFFIAASKSGTTTEPNTLLDYFYNRAFNRLGRKARQRFAVITDPDSKLEELARERRFCKVFQARSSVGGRYSALSYFGLVHAGVLGLDARAMLEGAAKMAAACGPRVPAVRNPGVALGGMLAAAWKQGRDKLTLVADPGLEPLADWIEQLVAESSGKDGIGILPIIGEPPGYASVYGADRIMVYLRSKGSLDRKVSGWAKAKLPVLVVDTDLTEAGIGAAFFQWELATAAACHLIGVNAFDQPNVQSAKTRTASLLKTLRETSKLPQLPTLWKGSGVTVSGQGAAMEGENLAAVLREMLAELPDGEPVHLLAYLRNREAVLRRYAKVRKALRDTTGRSSTFGFGPRYLHSTGQLHKGGRKEGLFLVITVEPVRDVALLEEN